MTVILRGGQQPQNYMSNAKKHFALPIAVYKAQNAWYLFGPCFLRPRLAQQADQQASIRLVRTQYAMLLK